MTNSRWRTSSFSGGENNDCVELDLTGSGSAIRDSKNPTGPVLSFDTTAWSALLETAKHH